MELRKLTVFKFGLATIILGILAFGCAGPAKDAAEPANATDGESLYLTDSDWTNSHGQKVRLGELRGAPRVLTMVFTKCPSACPMIISDMKKVEAALSPAVRERVRFTVFSFDPERDTPNTLSAFAKKMSLGTKWDLLVSSESNTRELAAILGVQYKKIPSGDFVHTNMLIAVDENGAVLAQREGLTGSLDELAKKLNSKFR